MAGAMGTAELSGGWNAGGRSNRFRRRAAIAPRRGSDSRRHRHARGGPRVRGRRDPTRRGLPGARPRGFQDHRERPATVPQRTGGGRGCLLGHGADGEALPLPGLAPPSLARLNPSGIAGIAPPAVVSPAAEQAEPAGGRAGGRASGAAVAPLRLGYAGEDLVHVHATTSVGGLATGTADGGRTHSGYLSLGCTAGIIPRRVSLADAGRLTGVSPGTVRRTGAARESPRPAD